MSIYQLTVAGTFNTMQVRNVHHYEFPGYIPTALELAEAVQVVADAYEEVMLAAFSPLTIFEAIEARRVDIGDQPSQEIVPSTWPLAGTGAGNPFPPQVSMLIVWKAATAFPRSTRSYLFPFVVNAGTTTGRVSSTWTIAAGIFQLALEVLPVTGQPDAQKVAVKYGGDPRVVVDWNIVSASPVDTIFATQRSRRYGVGV